MDDKAQMYVYEAVTVVILIIATVYFITTFASAPTVSYSSRLNQLQMDGQDALRIADNKGFLRTGAIDALNFGSLDDNSQLVEFLDDTLERADYKLSVDKKIYYESSSETGDSTVNANRLIVDNEGTIHDVQIVMWYKFLNRG